MCGFASATEADEALLPELLIATTQRFPHRRAPAGHRPGRKPLQAPRLATLGDAVAALTDDLETPRRRPRKRSGRSRDAGCADPQTIKASRDALKDSTRPWPGSRASSGLGRPGDSTAELATQQGNQLRMTLPTFVLLQRFEEVVDLANVRLSAMTDGRYQSMRRTDAKEGRSQKLPPGWK